MPRQEFLSGEQFNSVDYECRRPAGITQPIREKRGFVLFLFAHPLPSFSSVSSKSSQSDRPPPLAIIVKKSGNKRELGYLRQMNKGIPG